MANVKMAVLFGIVAIVVLLASYLAWTPTHSITVLVSSLLALGLVLVVLFVASILGWILNPTAKKKK